MKVIINGDYLWYLILSTLMAINYIIEGLLWYAGYLLIQYWIDTGEETFFWIVGTCILIFLRAAISMAEADDDDIRARHFNFHWVQFFRTLATIRYFISKVPVEFEIK